MKKLFACLSIALLLGCGSGEGKAESAELHDLNIKALHFTLNQSLTMDQVKGIIDLAETSGYNTILIMLPSWNVRFDALTVPRYATSFTMDQLTEIVQYARDREMDVIPQLQLLTHQGAFFRSSYPSLMYDDQTYDPRNPEVYVTVFAVLDEVIAAMTPKIIHIGHDEVKCYPVWAKSTQCPAGVIGLPADLFNADVETLYFYLKERDIKTWMWGDMLLDKDEFPGLTPARYAHGTPEYAALRETLPHGIVINDWRYTGSNTDFPTTSAFLKSGFKVIGATWQDMTTTRNFSNFIRQQDDGRAIGMMATTWYYIGRYPWDEFNRIIMDSGAIFSQQ